MSSRLVSPVTHSLAQLAALNCKSVVLLTRTCKNAWLATRSETRPSLPDTRSHLALQGGFASEFNCNRYPRATPGECRQTPEVRGRRPFAARSARSFDLIPHTDDCYFLYQKRELRAEIRSGSWSPCRAVVPDIETRSPLGPGNFWRRKTQMCGWSRSISGVHRFGKGAWRQSGRAARARQRLGIVPRCWFTVWFPHFSMSR